jgi:site-specific DNA-cytosine methylase
VRVLVACEESQAVTIEFRKLGHEAFSCDLQECSGGHPEWHIKGDIRDVLRHELTKPIWDMVIAFPPCTDLAVSGARYFKQKREDGRQYFSIKFFEFFTYLKTPMIAIENPIGIMSTHYRKPDQIIHPWQFGHGETKATCLWLHGLPKLQPTNIVSGREQRVWKMPPSSDRAKLRSKTYEGIARAMAEQWGGIQ